MVGWPGGLTQSIVDTMYIKSGWGRRWEVRMKCGCNFRFRDNKFPNLPRLFGYAYVRMGKKRETGTGKNGRNRKRIDEKRKGRYVTPRPPV